MVCFPVAAIKFEMEKRQDFHRECRWHTNGYTQWENLCEGPISQEY